MNPAVLTFFYTLLLLVCGPLRAAASSRPNILFLFADDQRADTIAALGNAVIQTPNLDRLVRRGLSFNRAYMQGSFNAATCIPSRAMLISGRNLFQTDEKLLRDGTWPAAFGEAGYTTFVSGKWHNGVPSLVRSFQHARRMFLGGMGNPMKVELTGFRDGKPGKPEPAGKHACEVFADETIRFLSEHKDGPFLCFVPFDAPHDPHIVPEEFPIHYDPAKIPLPPDFLPQHPWDNGEMTIRDEKLLPWPRTPEQVRAMLAEYYRYISYLDAQIGRVLEALAASPHADNTIVVFSADSGVARGSHGLIGKQNLYEHSVRVPLVLSGPGIPRGRRTDAMCYLFDLLPTLGKVCAVPGPAASTGIEFSASLRDPAQPARPHLMFAYKQEQRAVRDDRWKLIHYPEVDRTQLFDLKEDPQETTNLAGQPGHAARQAELSSLLAAEMSRHGDTPKGESSGPKPQASLPPAETRQTRVATVMGTPGCVAFWDFVNREEDGTKRFLAHVPPGAGNDYPLDAGNYVRDYWQAGPAAGYADFPLLGRGPFGQAVRIRRETDPDFRPFLFVPRTRLQDSTLDLKGSAQSVSLVVWAIRESGNHALAGIWHEGTDLKQKETSGIAKVERGQRQYALFAGLNKEGTACGHVSENGASSFLNRYALHKSNSAGISPAVPAGADAGVLDASWQCFAMTFDHTRQELTGWLNGSAGDRWLENPSEDKLISSAWQAWRQGHFHREPGLQPDEDPHFPQDQYYNPPEGQPLSVKVLRETAEERMELREFRYTKVACTLRRAADGTWPVVHRDLVALRLNPWWYPHGLYAPANDGSGGPFTIGRVIHSSRSVGFTGWIGGVAVFNRALSATEMEALASLRHPPVLTEHGAGKSAAGSGPPR